MKRCLLVLTLCWLVGALVLKFVCFEWGFLTKVGAGAQVTTMGRTYYSQ